MISLDQLALAPDDRRRVHEALGHFWGFQTLRPLQEAGIAAAAQGRDSLVVLPTGGGKSLCYQIPPLLSGGTDVVVSPLIALMKDQVDGLRERGYPAAALHSGLTAEERGMIERELDAAKLKLIFAAPERLLTEPFLRQLARLGVRRFAIDEAHCISHWGHDFRPEYRRLAELRGRFPRASIHGFTATATQRVREDIVQQLRLSNPAVLVGSFDRPNLVYRVVPRADVYSQVVQVLRRHKDEAAIVYCLSRRETEEMAAHLRLKKVSAAAYHAGMDAQARRKVQDAFAAERLDVVAATIAFGMGIDRSNIRCVLHTCIPKSIEHYQQETGRAGRDGLEAECVLFYSAADVMRWESLMQSRRAGNAAEKEVSPEAIAAAAELLKHMQRFCNTPQCRHRTLVNYFGQSYEADNCKACDVCLGEIKGVMEATVLAQKILSCVARVKETFGITHVLDVLLGSSTERVQQYGHDRLSTFGLVADLPRKVLTNLVYQLVDQELLVRTPGDRPILKLNAASWEVMRGQRQVKLLEPRVEFEAMRTPDDGWEGVDRGLFEHLRGVRRAIAEERSVPAFVVLSDATLRQVARVRPSGVEGFGRLHGVGDRKTADLGPRFVRETADYCGRKNLPMDQKAADEPAEGDVDRRRRRRVPKEAAGLFRGGRSIQEVMAVTGRAEGTVCKYLAAFILQERPDSIDAWVKPDVYRDVAAAAAAEQESGNRLRPIFDRLNGQVSFSAIRLVLAHREALKSRDVNAGSTASSTGPPSKSTGR